MTEEERVFLEDLFIEHSDYADVFSGEALDLLPDIVHAAMTKEPGLVFPEDAWLKDHRVSSLLYVFFGKAEVLLRKKAEEKAKGGVNKATAFNAADLSEGEKKMLRRIVAAGLYIADRRQELVKELRQNTVSFSSVARLMGVDRETISYNCAPLRACLVDFMGQYVMENDAGRRRKKVKEVDLAELVRANDERLQDAQRRIADLELCEVKYRQAKATIAQQQKDIEIIQQRERKTADKYLRLKEICEAHGINVPIELDELERLEAEAMMFRQMQNGNRNTMA